MAASPLPDEPNYLCRRCQFSLTGLTPTDDVLTCPECGLSGPVGHVAEPDPPPFPPWWSVRMMWPVTLVALLAAILVVIEVQTGADIVGILWPISVIAAIVMSVVVPSPVARELSQHHVREHRRRRVALVLSAIGFGINCAQLLLIALLTWVIVQLFLR